MGDEELVVLASLLAGVAGTGLGGILGALLGAENRSVACYMLAFAGVISVLAACLELAVGRLLTEDIRVVDIGFSSWHRLVSANLINSS